MSSTTPLYRHPAARRRELVEPIVGRGVTVYIDPHRNGGARPIPGVLRCIAYLGGTTTDVVVVELDPGSTVSGGYRTVAIPGAQVAGIRYAGPSPRNTIGRVPQEGSR